MRVMMALMLLLALTGMTAAQDKPAGTSPDKTTPAPIEFRDSPVEELLNWARKRTGCGFIFDADHLLDEGKKPLKVSYTPATEGGEQDDILVLFECLKRAGLVAMEVQGLEDITYHILPVNEAIGYADVAWEFEQLEGLYFGTLRVEARTIAIDKIEAIARKFLSRHGQITALPETSILLVSDFVDNLYGVSRACEEAQIPTERDDDTVSDVFQPARHDASRLRLAVEDARTETEQYAIALHEGSSALLVTGRRCDVQSAMERLGALDKLDEAPAGTISYRRWDARSLPVEELVKALNEFFAEDIRRLSVRLAAVPLRRQVLIECSASRYESAKALLERIDPLPGQPIGGKEQK